MDESLNISFCSRWERNIVSSAYYVCPHVYILYGGCLDYGSRHFFADSAYLIQTPDISYFVAT